MQFSGVFSFPLANKVFYLNLPDHTKGGVLCKLLLQPVDIDKLVQVLHPLIEVQVH